MTDTLTRTLITRIMLPLGLLVAVTLAVAVLIARQTPGNVVIVTLRPDRIGILETIGILDLNRPGTLLALELPGSFRSTTSATSRRYVASATGLQATGGNRILYDLFTGRTLELPQGAYENPSRGDQFTAVVVPPENSDSRNSGALYVVDRAAWQMRPVPGGPISQFAGWSSDNRLAFIRDGRLLVTAPGGDNPTPVTSPEASHVVQTQFSPDATQLAFLSIPEDGSSVQLWLVDLASDTARTIDAPPTIINFRWSLDSSRLLVYSNDGDNAVVDVVDAQTGTVESLSAVIEEGTPPGMILTQAEGYNFRTELEASPDGQHLAVAMMLSVSSFRSRLLLIDLQASTIDVSDADGEVPQGWSSDGRHLLVRRIIQLPDAFGDFPPGFIVYAFDGSTLQPVRELPTTVAQAAWIPGQNRIVYLNQPPAGFVSEVYLLDVETGAHTFLTGNVSDLLYVGP